MNLLLIGMPGCGKTTIGRRLAKAMQKPFCDIDARIEEEQGKKISDIFSSVGENGFRDIETKTLASVKGMGAVVSTGGGIVVRDENLKLLKELGLVIFIDRSLDDIMGDIKTEDRPLLSDGRERLKKLHEQRYARYLAVADLRIENTESISQVVDKILDEVKKYEDNGYKRTES